VAVFIEEKPIRVAWRGAGVETRDSLPRKLARPPSIAGRHAGLGGGRADLLDFRVCSA